MPSEVESPMWTTARQEVRRGPLVVGAPEGWLESTETELVRLPEPGPRVAIDTGPVAGGGWIWGGPTRIAAVTEVTGAGGVTPASPTQASTTHARAPARPTRPR